jgi:hypothetical protein
MPGFIATRAALIGATHRRHPRDGIVGLFFSPGEYTPPYFHDRRNRGGSCSAIVGGPHGSHERRELVAKGRPDDGLGRV